MISVAMSASAVAGAIFALGLRSVNSFLPQALLHPGIQFQAVKGLTLGADLNHAQMRAHVAIEGVATDPQVRRRLARSNEAGK